MYLFYRCKIAQFPASRFHCDFYVGFLLSPKEIGHDMNIVLLHKKAAACFYSCCSDVHFRENVQEDTEYLLQL